MSLYRSMGRGSWIVQRVLLGIPVRRRTGCHEKADAQVVEQTLLKLAEHGLRDLILAFDRKQITGPELVAGIERYGLTFQFTVENTARVRWAMWDWLLEAELAPKTRADYRWNIGALLGVKLPKLDETPTAAQERTLRSGPVITDLPLLLARYVRKATPSMAVQVKAVAQAYARDRIPMGDQSALWRELAAIRGKRRRPRRSVQGGLSPASAREVSERLGRLGPMWWTLCCTGMGKREYWRFPREPLTGRWQVLSDRIVVHGTKRESRERIVPRLTTPVRPLLGEKRFALHLKGVGQALGIPRLTPYVGRRTFAHFLELAKSIPDSRCDAYMGHSPKSDRAKYREHDVGPYLSADTAALRSVVGPEPRYLEVMA